jgi:CxxC motif-containing protein (DUF1111 family)
MMKWLMISGLLAMVTLAACTSGADTSPEAVTADSPGDPLPGLSPEELDRFHRGKAVFAKVFTPENGLGPLFNENQCSACHTGPATGGTGDQAVLRATRFDPDHGCDLLEEAGGENIRSRATPLLRASGIQREEIPREATEVARILVPFLFGLGMAEAVPEETLHALADPEDRDGDGVSGRLARTVDGRPGRFGTKADFATLEEFNAGAFHQEMGITNPLRPESELLNGRPLPEGVDPLPEPEIDGETLDLVTDFVRFLAPLSRRTPSDSALRRQVERGEVLFREVGCVSCHVPVLATGNHPVAALRHKRVALYSDLLLHDLGPGVSGVCGPDASPTEVRTGILMGLGYRRVFLHQGQASTLQQAISLHGGEAERSRRAFEALPEVERHFLVRFLQTL